MANTKLISSFLIFLILSSFMIDVKARVSVTEKSLMERMYGEKQHNNNNAYDNGEWTKVNNLIFENRNLGKASDAGGVVSACFSGINSSLAPAFCWRKGKDMDLSWGTSCDAGWTKRLFMCVKNCRSGYEYKLGMCRKKCRSGYSMKIGLVCYKNIFKMYISSGYFPSRAFTNCDKGYVRLAGNLCSKSCEWGRNTLTGEMERTQMKNCGPLACSNSTIGCISTIIQMAIDTVLSVVTFIGFIGTAGASTAAAVPAKAAVAQAGKSAVKGAMKQAVKQMAGQAQKTFTQKVIDAAKKKLIGKIKSTTIKKICEAVIDNVKGKEDQMEKNIDETDDESFGDELVDTAIAMVDVFGVKTIKDECTKGIDTAGCIAGIIGAAAVFDPTGILGLIATFVKPICNLDIPPTDAQKQDAADKANKAIRSTIDALKPGCVTVYEHCYYQGKHQTICRDDDDPGNREYYENFGGEYMNDKISSIISAKDTFAAFFEHTDMRGRHFTLGPEDSIACLNDMHIDGLNMNDMVSTVNVSLEIRHFFKMKVGFHGVPNPPVTPYFIYSELFWGDRANIPAKAFSAHVMNYLEIEPFTTEYKLQICDQPNYQGNCFTVDEFWYADDYQKSPEKLSAWRSCRILKNNIDK